MTETQKKAKELIEKFKNLSIDILHTDCEGDAAIASGNPIIKDAKILAILCVDEILNNPKNYQRGISEDLHDEFWQEVRNDIIYYKN